MASNSHRSQSRRRVSTFRWHHARAVTEEKRRATEDEPPDFDLIERARSLAQSAASDAAPYYHNRLSSIEVGNLAAKPPVPGGKTITTVVKYDLSDASMQKLLALVK